jgi:hypothetical protein
VASIARVDVARAEAAPEWPAHVDARLVRAFAEAPGSSQSIWVRFRDRGESDARDLASMIAAAEASLTPRARARRIRCRVRPLTDERDVPVHAPYLAALEAQGARPHAVSRWFNQAAVRLDPAAARRVASLACVASLSPVERGDAVPRGEEAPVHLRGRTPGTGAGERRTFATTIDYGAAANQAREVHATAVHDSGYTGAGVLISVLDSGFDGHDVHEALAGISIAPGHRRDFVDGDTTVTGDGHGTNVLGCIAGYRPGTYVGTAFDADFALARTENRSYERRQEMVFWLMGAEWSDSIGADVLTSSLGYFTFDDPSENYTPDSLDGQTTIISRAGQIAASKGILVLNAAGNNGQGPPSWRGKIVAPADVDGDSLLAIGAYDVDGTRAWFSSIGPTADGRIKPDLMARGVDAVTLSSTGSGYVLNNGTSFSTPVVAGLAACILQARPTWSAAEVIRVLRETASRARQPDTLFGYGVPNGLAALAWPAPPNPKPSGRPGIAMGGPNPLRSGGPPTLVHFALHQDAASASGAKVRVYDVGGRVVRELWTGTVQPGQWETTEWDGRTAGGDRPAGVFFISFEVNGRHEAVRVVSLP